MIIPLNKKTLFINLDDDVMENRATNGDVVFIQEVDRVKRSYIDDLIEYFNENLPLELDLLNEEELKPKPHSDYKILGAYIFKNFSVNGKKFNSESNFLAFIREKLSPVKKIRFCIYPTTKLEEEWNINNLRVLDDLYHAVDNQGYVIDALNYIKSEDRLDFVTNIYGSNATRSKVFYDDKKNMRKLKNFSKFNIKLWSDLQFSINCLNLLEKYNLTEKFLLLNNRYYCKKRFNLNYKIITKQFNDNEKDVYSNEKFYFNYKHYHVLSSWENSKELFWEWLLDCINEVSNDVILEDIKNINYLKLPVDYLEDIHNFEEILNIKFKIISEDSNKNVDSENESIVTVNNKHKSKFEKNYRRYFINQRLNQRLLSEQEIVLVNPFLTEFLSYDLFKIRAIKEQGIILVKGNGFINKDKSDKILDMIRSGDFDE